MIDNDSKSGFMAYKFSSYDSQKDDWVYSQQAIGLWLGEIGEDGVYRASEVEFDDKGNQTKASSYYKKDEENGEYSYIDTYNWEAQASKPAESKTSENQVEVKTLPSVGNNVFDFNKPFELFTLPVDNTYVEPAKVKVENNIEQEGFWSKALRALTKAIHSLG